jgi:hypothetical protein
MAARDIMAEKPTYQELERKIKKLEKEALDYLRKEEEFNEERRLTDYGHLKRTVSLLKINDELNREIEETKSAGKEKLEQKMVDFIPPACQHPENTCARIIFDRYELTTKNFLETNYRQSFNITVRNEQIRQLEVFRLEKRKGLKNPPFLEEEKSLIGAIAESISRIVEREWA